MEIAAGCSRRLDNNQERREEWRSTKVSDEPVVCIVACLVCDMTEVQLR